ncbi:hypothetical protein TELCIR_22231 [Teladorsagia circumcincta]|uniref:CUB domain-containing protein n=1 Tax=Teladorsagia circumcincta TaxID=45464 RepID=A0A2G9TGA6_TELCI|nr:hypothetical protein TELCIR_22231 [Teladorsagia circumcincta]
METGSQDGYKKCNYWIKAPNGTTIEVKIVNLPAGVAVDGCIYAGVEIKTHPDQRRTGYRFCSKDDVNTTLTSNSTTVPILTYMRRRRNSTGIVLGYRYTTEMEGSEV